MANASPFQQGEFDNDEYEDHKLVHSNNFNNRSQLTSNQEETNSTYGSKSYMPSRIMLHNIVKEGLITKEALVGEIMENKTINIVKETLAH